MDLTQLITGNSSEATGRSENTGNYTSEELEEIMKLLGEDGDLADMISSIDVEELDESLPDVELSNYVHGSTIGKWAYNFYYKTYQRL